MIVHHWDTDGITSAAIYLNMFGEDELFTPKIGNFYLDHEDFSYIKNFKKIVVLDMNLPKVNRICKYADLYIYDHHRANRVECAIEHYNPFLSGVFYPSCTVVLMERFSYSPDYLVALGIVGDKGNSAKNISEWNIVKKVMEKENLNFDELKRTVELLDSSFKLRKRDEVIENVHLVRQGIRAVLESQHLHKNVSMIEKLVEEWVEKSEDRGNYIFLQMKSPYQIISTVTRKIAWGKGKLTIVINRKIDRDEFYIRSPNNNFNALPLIEMAHRKGYKAGGKKEVMGVILPRGEGENFTREVLEVLGW